MHDYIYTYICMGIIYVKMYINSFSYMCRLGHLSDSAAIIIQINIFFAFSHTLVMFFQVSC